MTASPQLPDEVREFVERNLDTVAQLEGLLLMRESATARWSAPQLAARLYISAQDAQTVLAALHRRQLLEVADGEFGYAPANEGLRVGVDRLAAAYPRHLIAITRLIHAKPSASVRNFADAFRLRDKE
jgi:hypothetical protein